MSTDNVFKEVKDFYRIIPLQALRRTPGVYFDNVPMEFLPRIDAIDRVLHQGGAVSPGPVGEVQRPWYMHPHQDDNLIVLYGVRDVDIYINGQGMTSFRVTPHQILQKGKVLYDGPAMLVWPRYVFHRITSGAEGSASLNFAVHYHGLDMRTNFNIYDLDTDTGHFEVIREGFRDQGKI
ncbi:hypothetical protein [Desulfonatronospira sp.]|uniref:hypothetical protein n=1 Tax=Desulfonatronospira sp. TaxID=1962951 RepID=UPI0025BCEDA9|nr:hypothetical protein [Desulfonatronospira sp.]